MPLFGMSPVDAQSSQLANYGAQMNYQAPDVPQMPQKTHFFGEGGAGRAIAGNIGDALLQFGHMQPIYGPQIQAQQEAAQRASQLQLQQAAEYARQKQMYDYELANPKPVHNDTADDYEFWKQKLSPEDFKAWLANKVSPPRYMTGPNGEIVILPSGGAPSAPAGRPALGTIVNDLPPEGGQTPPASGGFPGRPW